MTMHRASKMAACLLAVAGVVLAPVAARAADASAWSGALVFTQEPPGAWVKAGKAGWPLRIAKPDGARIVVVEPGKEPRALSAGFQSACGPCVSMDGTRVLFAGKEKPGSAWGIYEIGADGSGLRAVARGPGDRFEPHYLARGAIVPPDYKDKVRWIVFTSTASGASVEAGGEKCTSLYAQSLEPIPGRGIVTWRTTWNLSSDFSPTVMSDGRVLFASWQDFPGRFGDAGGAAAKGAASLFTISWSGEDINAFLPPGEPGVVRSMACETADRYVVFVESDASEPDRAGHLARVSLRRPLKTFEVVGKGPGRYRDPQPLPDGRLLVSYAAQGRPFALYAFDFEKGAPGDLLRDDPAWSDVEAMPLVARPEPLGRITMVNERAKTATLTCLNLYDSDRAEVRTLPKGTVKKVRFIEGVAAGAVPAAARVLGEAPVEQDGSFLVQIVPDTPFTMQLLDGNGSVLADMHTWIWLPRGDERTCIGCHEDKEMAPENRATQALIKGKAWPVLAPAEERRMAEIRSGGAAVLTNGGGR